MKYMDFVTEIEKLLIEISGDFDPPLSQTLNLKEYSIKMVSKSTIFSVIENGSLVAFMSVYCNDPEKSIAFGTMLAVSKTHRIYHVGPNLIKTTLDYLKKYGFKKFSLEIYKTNPRVITLYKRLGFVLAGESTNSVYVEKNL